jgi:hypothetical protein
MCRRGGVCQPPRSWQSGKPPRGAVALGTTAPCVTQDRRRTYDRGLEALDDALLGLKVAWQNRPLAEALGEAIEKLLERNLLAIVEE